MANNHTINAQTNESIKLLDKCREFLAIIYDNCDKNKLIDDYGSNLWLKIERMDNEYQNINNDKNQINTRSNECFQLLYNYLKYLKAIYRCCDQNKLIKEYGSNLYLKFEQLESKYQNLINNNKRVNTDPNNDIDLRVIREHVVDGDDIIIVDEVCNDSKIIDCVLKSNTNSNHAYVPPDKRETKAVSARCDKPFNDKTLNNTSNNTSANKTDSLPFNSKKCVRFDDHIIDEETTNMSTINYYIIALVSKKLGSINRLIGYRCNVSKCGFFIHKDMNVVSEHIINAHNICRQFKCQLCLNTFFENKTHLNDHRRNRHHIGNYRDILNVRKRRRKARKRGKGKARTRSLKAPPYLRPQSTYIWAQNHKNSITNRNNINDKYKRVDIKANSDINLKVIRGEHVVDDDDIIIVGGVYNDSKVIDYGHKSYTDLKHVYVSPDKREMIADSARCDKPFNDKTVNNTSNNTSFGKTDLLRYDSKKCVRFDDHIVDEETTNMATNNYYIIALVSKKMGSINRLIGYRCNVSKCGSYIHRDMNVVSEHVKSAHNIWRQFECQLCLNTFFENTTHLNDHMREKHNIGKYDHMLKRKIKRYRVKRKTPIRSLNPIPYLRQEYQSTSIWAENLKNSVANRDITIIRETKPKEKVIFNGHIIGTDTKENQTKHKFISAIVSIKPESMHKFIGYRCNIAHCDYLINENLAQTQLHVRNVHGIRNF